MNIVKAAASSAVTLTAFTIIAAEEGKSVNDVMVEVIAPASDTIWGIEDPQSDEDWQVYVDAAATLIDATAAIRAGGSGPNDAAWAAEAEWQRFADALIDSGREVQAAARARDLDALIDASNEKMYPPCEECHLQFHPGVQQ